MKLILIQGFDKCQKIWIDNILKYFDLYFNDIILFKHTKDMSKIINESDINIEADKLNRIINKFDDDYVIFAQTTGIFVALKLITKTKKKPVKCMFLDIPIIRARINNISINKLLKNYDINTLFIQNKTSPDYELEEIELYLNEQKTKNYNLVELNTTPESICDIKTFNYFFRNYMFYLNPIIYKI